MSNQPRSVVFVGAHPDDETVMVGGTLAMLHEHGVPTHVICMTDGRGGEAGGVPGVETPDALAKIRLEELRCAALALGVTGLTWLGYEDPVMGADDQLFGFAADETTLVAQIAALIRERAADVVLTHGSNGEYGHPAHIQVHRAVMRAAREHTPDAIIYGVAARVPTIEDRLWNENDPAHFALDVSPWRDVKLAALVCHRTQHELFKRRRKLQHVSEAIRLVEAFHRHWPAVSAPDGPKDAFAALLCEVGAWVPQHREQS